MKRLSFRGVKDTSPVWQFAFLPEAVSRGRHTVHQRKADLTSEATATRPLCTSSNQGGTGFPSCFTTPMQN